MDVQFRNQTPVVTPAWLGHHECCFFRIPGVDVSTCAVVVHEDETGEWYSMDGSSSTYRLLASLVWAASGFTMGLLLFTIRVTLSLTKREVDLYGSVYDYAASHTVSKEYTAGEDASLSDLDTELPERATPETESAWGSEEEVVPFRPRAYANSGILEEFKQEFP